MIASLREKHSMEKDTYIRKVEEKWFWYYKSMMIFSSHENKTSKWYEIIYSLKFLLFLRNIDILKYDKWKIVDISSSWKNITPIQEDGFQKYVQNLWCLRLSLLLRKERGSTLYVYAWDLQRERTRIFLSK